MKGFWRNYLKVMVASLAVGLLIMIIVSPVNAAGIANSVKTIPKASTPARTPASVFIVPGLFDLPAKAFIDLQLGDYKQAGSVLKTMIRWFPYVPALDYDIKGDRARRKYSRLILEKLSEVLDRSFRLVKKIPQKNYLQARKRYEKISPLIKQAIEALSQYLGGKRGKPSPRKITNFKAVVDSTNTGWDPRLNVLKILFAFEAEKPALKNPVSGRSPAAVQVNAWYKQGLAAGNYGDLYDNRDSGHSRLNLNYFPQMSAVVYGKQARDASMHYGLNTKNFFNAITIGNSSTARGGMFWRSQTRIALTTPGAPQLLYLQYITNHLYFYPEHRDHDPKSGDVMPANTPYLITSQGSSGSDQPFLRAIATILAAFRPQVKQALKKSGLVMPTVQMIFRRGQKGIKNDEDYLSGKAHPSVFRSEDMDVLKMARLANGLTIEDVPPMVGIKMVEESGIETGIDPVPGGQNDRLFDTPGAIARIVRSTAYEKRMLVQAAYKGIGKSGKVSYRWVVLRGDAGRIKIIPKNTEGSLVEIRVPWHERSPVPGRPELSSDRVDIGVFVSNSKYLSAPAFISLMYPGNQVRVYNKNKQILSVDYQNPKYTKRYTDPLLFPDRNWRDTYTYDVQGRLIGWQRLMKNKRVDYTRDGAIVVKRDGSGRALKAQKVKYHAQPESSGRQGIVIQRLPKYLYYQYGDEKDQIGAVVRK